MYADRMSDAMASAIAETEKRRKIQVEYNEAHGITPTTVKKAVQDILTRRAEEEKDAAATAVEVLKKSYNVLIPNQRKQLIRALEGEMLEHAKNLEFEMAAAIRDEIAKVKEVGNR
jgi:excinuclease ABC subunit B